SFRISGWPAKRPASIAWSPARCDDGALPGFQPRFLVPNRVSWFPIASPGSQARLLVPKLQLGNLRPAQAAGRIGLPRACIRLGGASELAPVRRKGKA